VYFSYEVAKNATVSQLLAVVTGNHAIEPTTVQLQFIQT
jgi:hypothetical protein